MKFLTVMAIIFMACSCTKRAVEPTRQSRHTIDTIFQQRSMALKSLMDAKCDSLFSTVYDKAIDSIMAERRKEITNLIK